MAGGQTEPKTLARYVPRISAEWDLDTPGAVSAIDDAVAQGEDVTAAAALLGILL